MKPAEREEARKLRREDGLALRAIAARLGLIQSIYGAIQEYAGFDRPAWLD